MKRVISWLSLIIIIVALGWYMVYLSTPDESEITSREVKVETVTKDIIDENVISELKKLVSHGNLPVTVEDSEIGKSSPFE